MQVAKFLAVIAFSLSQVMAGVGFTNVTLAKDKKGKTTLKTVVEGKVEGKMARFDFVESSNPMMPTGTYMVTKDGNAFYLVNPKQKTYQEFNLDDLVKFTGNVLNAMQGFMSLKFSDPKVTLLAQDAGGKILAKSTTRYHYKTSYDLTMKVIGIKRLMESESVQEIWAAPVGGDLGISYWLRPQPPTSGNDELDKILASEYKKINGFPMKSKTKTTTRTFNKKRTKVKKEEVSYQESEVTQWAKGNFSKGIFEVPSDYEQTQGLLGGGESEGNPNPLSGLFGKKKEKK